MAKKRNEMRGRICVVTGANAGIGRATAMELARRGATVAMVCRSPERGEAARAEIRRESGNDAVELLLADLASQAEVRRLAAEIQNRFPRVDVLVNNAAVFTRERTLSADGIELQLAVNHLSPFLLTTLLLDRLRSSAPARVVNVSSEAHRSGRLDWDNLQGERGYSAFRAYSNSKLANILFTRELALRLKGTGVTANALHPGVIGTDLLLGGWAALRLLRPVLQWFLKSPEQGARTSVYLASSPAIAGVTGRYFKDCESVEPAPQAQDPEAARRLWQMSERLTGLAGARGCAIGTPAPLPCSTRRAGIPTA